MCDVSHIQISFRAVNAFDVLNVHRLMPDPPTATATNATEPKTAPTIIAVGVEVLASAGLGGNTFGVVPGA